MYRVTVYNDTSITHEYTDNLRDAMRILHSTRGTIAVVDGRKVHRVQLLGGRNRNTYWWTDTDGRRISAKSIQSRLISTS